MIPTKRNEADWNKLSDKTVSQRAIELWSWAKSVHGDQPKDFLLRMGYHEGCKDERAIALAEAIDALERLVVLPQQESCLNGCIAALRKLAEGE